MKKTCTKCCLEKDSSEFRRDKTNASGFHPHCKVCARAHFKSTYSTKYGMTYNVRNNERRAHQLQLLNEYKATLHCIVCNEKDSCCLEFHHIDPSKKDFTIGSSMTRSWESILKEIQKCMCVCSNCHKKIHAGKLEIGQFV